MRGASQPSIYNFSFKKKKERNSEGFFQGFLSWVVRGPFLKIVINLTWIHKKLHVKGEPSSQRQDISWFKLQIERHPVTFTNGCMFSSMNRKYKSKFYFHNEFFQELKQLKNNQNAKLMEEAILRSSLRNSAR